MELLSIDFLGQSLRLEGSMAGWQQVFWSNTLVAQQAASADDQDNYLHEFQLTQGETVLTCRLEVKVTWQPCQILP